MSILKLAKKLEFKYYSDLYKCGASEVFNILELTPTLKDIEKTVNDKSLNDSVVAKLAQDLFNKLVVPYLKMNPVNLTFKRDLDFFLHDLIHEALKEGSIKRFEEIDKGNDTEYNLQDYIDEDIAEYLSSSRLEGGLFIYFQKMSYKLDPSEIKSIDDLVRLINKKINEDLLQVKNNKQNKFMNHLKKVISYRILNSSDIIDKIKENALEPSDIKVRNMFRTIEVMVKGYLEDTLNKGQPIIEDELCASLIRRWLLAVKKGVNNLVAEEERLFSSNINNQIY